MMYLQGRHQGSQDSGADVARAWRGRGAGHRHVLAWGGAGVARAWRGRGAGMSCDPWGWQQGGLRARPATNRAAHGSAFLPMIRMPAHDQG
eukprot:gene352-biopygen22589